MAGRDDAVLERAHSLLPLLLAVPALVATGIVLADLLSVRYPALSGALANDGKALATGSPIYAEPGQQYTGMLYAPLFAALLAPLYRILWWDGWSLLIVILSGVGLGALVGGLAASGPGRQGAVRVVEGVGLGGLAWWLVSTNARHLLFIPRVDHLAWLFALAGLTVLALAVAHRWPRVWPAVLLLSAGLWTKQTTVGAAVAAVLAASWWAAAGAMPWGMWRRFVAGLVGVNAAAFAVLMAVTDGWIWYFFFDLPGRQYSDPAIGAYLEEILRALAIPLLAVVVAGGAAWQARRKGVTLRSFAVLLAGALVIFLVVQIAPSLLGRRKQGGGTGHYVGMMWALGMLLALAHREARRSRRALVAGIVVYASLAGIAFLPPLREGVTSPGVTEPVAMPRREIQAIDPAVVEYSRSHLVYDSFLGVVSPTRTEEVWPAQLNVVDLLAAGESPDYLIDALVDRHFDAVTPLDPQLASYVSASGRTPGGYVVALGLLAEAGYRPGANGAPAPLLGRAPGAMDLSWARSCFADEAPAQCMTEGLAARA